MKNDDIAKIVIPLSTKYPIKPNRYWVSKLGKVYWKDKDGGYRIMKPFTTKDGYIEYVLTGVNGKKIHVQAQLIVLATYKGYPGDGEKTQANHKDGVRKNNKPSNLEWVTPKENINHSFRKLGKVVWNSNKRLK